MQPTDENGESLTAIRVSVEEFRTFFSVIFDATLVSDKGIVRFEGKASETQEFKEAVLRSRFFLALANASALEMPKGPSVPFRLETKPGEKKAPRLVIDISSILSKGVWLKPNKVRNMKRKRHSSLEGLLGAGFCR